MNEVPWRGIVEISLDEYDALNSKERERFEPIDEENATSDKAWREKSRKRRKRKLPKVITGSEAAALLRAASNDVAVTQGERYRNRLILEFMYRAGLRVSETTTIRLRDVERDGVIKLYDAKGGDGTSYYDADRLDPLIETWLGVRDAWAREESPFFCRPDGKPMSVRYIQRLVKRLKDQIGIGGICTPHVLRHTFATELIEEGELTLPEVQAAMRHANLATTAVYLHVRDESLRRKIARRPSTPREEV